MGMRGRAVWWLNYSVYPKASVSQMGRRWPTGGAVALESRRNDFWTVLCGSVAAGSTACHAMSSA
jgi:hypothetical protein